ncbi:hypothetical protein QTN25_005133 [Entamoeba marina]
MGDTHHLIDGIQRINCDSDENDYNEEQLSSIVVCSEQETKNLKFNQLKQRNKILREQLKEKKAKRNKEREEKHCIKRLIIILKEYQVLTDGDIKKFSSFLSTNGIMEFLNKKCLEETFQVTINLLDSFRKNIHNYCSDIINDSNDDKECDNYMNVIELSTTCEIPIEDSSIREIDSKEFDCSISRNVTKCNNNNEVLSNETKTKSTERSSPQIPIDLEEIPQQTTPAINSRNIPECSTQIDVDDEISTETVEIFRRISRL